MEPVTVELPLIDEAALHAALQVAPGGGSWHVTMSQRVPGTGWDMELQLWTTPAGDQRHVAMRGPSVTGLSNGELEAELRRLVRIRDAAQAAMDVVGQHLQFRASLR